MALLSKTAWRGIVSRRFRALRVARAVGLLVILCGARFLANPRQDSMARLATGPEAAISGVVTDGHSGTTVAKAEVRLGSRDSAGHQVSQLTDDGGRFVFDHLQAGSYTLSVTKAGFGDARFGPDVMGALGASITLTTGQWFSTAHIRLTPLGSISGRISDAVGQPVAGAFVRLLCMVNIAGTKRVAAGPVTTSDDRGQYRVGNLIAGKYFVAVPSVQQSAWAGVSVSELEGLTPEQLEALDRQAIRQGVQPQRRVRSMVLDGPTAILATGYPAPAPGGDGTQWIYPPTFYPAAQSIADASPIEISEGDDQRGVDVTVRAVRGVAVSGQLEGTQQSYANTVLRLVPLGLEALGPGSEVATTLASAGGAFRFVNVPAGEYTLVVPGFSLEFALQSAVSSLTSRPFSLPSTPGLARFGSGASGGLVASAPGVVFNAIAPEANTGYARLQLSVGKADLAGLQVRLEPMGSVRCHVIYEDLTHSPPMGSLELAPADGDPGPGAHLFVINKTGNDPTKPIVDMAGLIPGRYALRPVGMGGVGFKSITIDGADASRQAFTVAPGQVSSMVVTFTGRVITVSGTVRDSKGAAVPATVVVIFPVDRQLWVDYGFTPTWIRAVASASDGSFKSLSLRAGDYFAIAVPVSLRAAWVNPDFLAKAAASASRLRVDWGETKDIQVPVIRQ
jgi:hypothetical protein